MSSTVQAPLAVVPKAQEAMYSIFSRKDHFQAKVKLESIAAREGSWRSRDQPIMENDVAEPKIVYSSHGTGISPASYYILWYTDEI